MVWFKVDDSFHSHPKLAELEESDHHAEAVALWVLAGSWSAQHLTDGVLKGATLRRLVPWDWRPAADALCEVGLWAEVDGGYRFHGWDEYQPTREETERKREDARERMRKRRQGRSREHRDNVRGDVPANDPGTVRDPRPDPSRPVPTSTLTGAARAREGYAALLRGYQARYEARRTVAWQCASKARTSLEEVSRWVGRQAQAEGRSPPEVAEQLLDGFFADSWAAEHDWPVGSLRENPGRYYAPPERAEQTEERSERAREIRRRLREEDLPQAARHGLQQALAQLEGAA